mmetsp:Transcript_43257/g.113948  ORF Transcript_43257/g.113948 Transcript_43257/m.113948 type:complete len:319 (-) Transcript_43257:126-1082(-)
MAGWRSAVPGDVVGVEFAYLARLRQGEIPQLAVRPAPPHEYPPRSGLGRGVGDARRDVDDGVVRGAGEALDLGDGGGAVVPILRRGAAAADLPELIRSPGVHLPGHHNQVVVAPRGDGRDLIHRHLVHRGHVRVLGLRVDPALTLAVVAHGEDPAVFQEQEGVAVPPVDVGHGGDDLMPGQGHRQQRRLLHVLLIVPQLPLLIRPPHPPPALLVPRRRVVVPAAHPRNRGQIRGGLQHRVRPVQRPVPHLPLPPGPGGPDPPCPQAWAALPFSSTPPQGGSPGPGTWSPPLPPAPSRPSLGQPASSRARTSCSRSRQP